MKEKIKRLVEERSALTNNHSGLYLPEISKALNIKELELRKTLNELFIEGFLKVRDGVNGKLIFKNNNK